MKYQTYLSLIGAANTIQIRQTTGYTDYMCQHAPTSVDGMNPPSTLQCQGSFPVWHAPTSTIPNCYWGCGPPHAGPATGGPGGPTGGPAGNQVDLCSHAPTGSNTHPPSTLTSQCDAGRALFWAAPVAGSTECSWQCRMPSGPHPGPGGPGGPTGGPAGMPDFQCPHAPTAADGMNPPSTLQCPASFIVWHGPTSTIPNCYWGCGPTQSGPGGPGGPTGGPTGIPADMCPHAPTGSNMHPPSTLVQQCDNGRVLDWAAPVAGSTECSWQCRMPSGPPAGPPMPSKADQIEDFANGFFQQCDADSNSFLTKSELKKCLSSMNTQMREGMKDQLDMQEQQMEKQSEMMAGWTSMHLNNMAKMVWNGASSQTGADANKGINKAEVVSYLNSEWPVIQAIINQPPPHMAGGMGGPGGPYGNSGDSGSSDSGYSGDSGSSDSGYSGDSGSSDSGYHGSTNSTVSHSGYHGSTNSTVSL